MEELNNNFQRGAADQDEEDDKDLLYPPVQPGNKDRLLGEVAVQHKRLARSVDGRPYTLIGPEGEKRYLYTDWSVDENSVPPPNGATVTAYSHEDMLLTQVTCTEASKEARYGQIRQLRETMPPGRTLDAELRNMGVLAILASEVES
jgi:hypothetical protein